MTDFWYNRILDPKTQVVTGLTRNGLFLIEGGEVTVPVQNLRYTQSVVGALAPGHVLGIGDDAAAREQRGRHRPRPQPPPAVLGLHRWLEAGDARSRRQNDTTEATAATAT